MAGQTPWRGPALPLKVRVALFFLKGFGRLAQRGNGTVNRFLFSIIDRRADASARPDGQFSVRSVDVDVDASRRLWARVFSPSEAQSPLPLLVYFHGGAFTFLSAASKPYDEMCRRFCRDLGAVVVSVNYRLAPEHRCPAAYEDGVSVLRYLGDTGLPGCAVPVDFSRCFVAGDSAGGNIAHHVAQRWTVAGTGSSSPPLSNRIRLAGAILVQPHFGGEERTDAEQQLDGKVPVVDMAGSDWSWRAFLPVGDSRDHRAAHVTDENAELGDDFPAALVVIGGYDPLQEWQRRYVGVLRQKGKAVELEEAVHGFFFFPELPENARLVSEMKAFMNDPNGYSAAA